jgi:uncharacterized membrane protein YhaH (DUF805 family)
VRPKTIVYFEGIIFGTLLVGVLQVYLIWDQAIARAIAENAPLDRNTAVALILTVEIFNNVLVGTLTLLVSRRRSKIAMWVSIALFAISHSVWFIEPPMDWLGSETMLSALQTIGQVVAYGLLFTPSARRWMNREDDLVAGVEKMEKSPKRLDRRTFWMWVVLLVLGHVLANVSMPRDSAALMPMIGIDEVILILLAIALARRFRDIGWPVWIGPTILLITIGLPFLGIGIIAMMNHGGDQIMQWLPLYGLISGPLNLVLLIVAGFVPRKPARA